jgi:CRP/FNR family transcriptional regulator, global nitrogen regulator
MAVSSPTVVCTPRSHGLIDDPLEFRGISFEGREILGLLHEAGAATVERRYARGEVLFGEGDPGDALYLLTEGAVKLSKGYPGGKDVTLMVLGPWEFFGDLTIGRRAYQHARAEAMMACRVSKAPRVFVERALRTHPEIALKLMDLLRMELVRQREMAACLQPHKAEIKLARLLPLLAQRFGERRNVGLVIQLRITQEELASMISSTRESVGHALASLRRQGMLTLIAGRLVILDPAGLEHLASGKVT